MRYRVPVTVKFRGGINVNVYPEIDDADLSWFATDDGSMRFDLDEAEDIAREQVMDGLTFSFGEPRPVVPYRALEGSEGGEDGR